MIIKKTDPAPHVTKLSLGKQLRGRHVLLRWWGVEDEIVEKSPAGGRGPPGTSHGPRTFSGTFSRQGLAQGAEFALLL